jgi:putative ABC transport system permease protein
MFRNYLKVALRNLWRSKGFSFINITGLAIGLASAMLIGLWIYNEVSYDRFHKNDSQLYQVWNRGNFDGQINCWDNVPKILGPTLRLEYPEIANVVRTNSRWFVTRTKDKKVSSSALIADSTFLSMFSFPMLEGNPNSALNNTYSLVITKRMATKMFGREEALNKVITIDSNNFTVTGVLKDLPSNTRFDFEMILPWSYLTKTGQNDENWGNNSCYTFVQLKSGTNPTFMNAKIQDVTIKHSGGVEQQELFLHHISKWHLYSRFENGKIVGGRIELVRMFGIIAAFILLIACINFMNLSTARSEKRAKEVGIRKAAGANKSLLVGQFLGESVLIALIAGIFAFFIVILCLPSFNLLVAKQLFVPYNNISFWLFVITFILITGLIAGSYPAFSLSSYKAAEVLKGTFKRVHAAINPRKVLVVLQFTFAIILVISTIIVTQQIKYAQKRQAGYEKGQLVYVWLAGELYDKFLPVKNELLRSGIATSVTRTNAPLTESFSNTWNYEWTGKSPRDKTIINTFVQDQDLVTTAGLKLVMGRDIDLDEYPTDSTAILLNESALKVMGFKDPIGQIIKYGDVNYHVVGIISDFVLESPFNNIAPMVIHGAYSNWFNIINIKLKPGLDVRKSLQKLEEIYTKYNPAYPFEYHFVDDDYKRKFDEAQQLGTLTVLFAGLTIFISCLGLFGLAAYMAQNRIKEIGIRKVLGASVLKISLLLSKDFLMLVIISLIIATPVAWYVMHEWLQNFAYRIQIQWWVFILAGAISVLISLVTVSYQAVTAAISNPVKSLRSE